MFFDIDLGDMLFNHTLYRNIRPHTGVDVFVTDQGGISK